MILPGSLQQILDDHVSGSITLLKRIMTVLEHELLDPGLEPATFIAYIETIRRKMEMFTVIRHFCDDLILSHNVSVKQYPVNYLEFIRQYKEFWEHAPQLLMNNLLKVVRLKNRTVMFHSNSGTITEVFRLLKKQEFQVRIIQTLSAPREEGRIQARELAGMGYNVTLIPDALAAEMLKVTDYLVLSADQVREHAVINKTGSLQMTLAAQQFNVPVIVLTESRKVNQSAGTAAFADQKHDPEEVLQGERHRGISAVNYYFEEVPRYLVSHIITEKKLTDRNE